MSLTTSLENAFSVTEDTPAPKTFTDIYAGAVGDLGLKQPVEAPPAPVQVSLGEDLSDEDFEKLKGEQVAAEIARVQSVTLEDHVGQLSPTNDILTHIAEDQQAHQRLEDGLYEIRGLLEAQVGAADIGRQVASPTVSVESIELAFINTSLESLARPTGFSAPRLVAEDGIITDASMEGLIDFIKAVGTKVSNWFKDLKEQMRLNELRAANNFANISARCQRLQNLISQMPESVSLPDLPKYDGRLLQGLRVEGALEIGSPEHIAAMQQCAALSNYVIEKIAMSTLDDINVLADYVPVVLVSPGADGGESRSKEAYGKLKLVNFDDKILTLDKPFAGGVKFKRIQGYRPSVTTASWVTPLVERLERPYLNMHVASVIRIQPAVATLTTIESVVNLIAERNAHERDIFNSWYTSAASNYRNTAEAYNKGLAIARNTRAGDSLTAEVWRAVDIASYAMLNLYNLMLNETALAMHPHTLLSTSSLYAIEEQVKGYVKANR